MFAGAATVSCFRPGEPTVERTALWIDTVKRGSLPRDILDSLPAVDVLYVGHPGYGHAGDALGIFRVVPNSGEAERITVQFWPSLGQRDRDRARREGR